jgi:hypothetical protein
MTVWNRRLIVTGLALILGGFLFSLAFSLSVDHQARLVAHEAYQPVLEDIVTDIENEDWRSLTAGITKTSIAHRRAADVHGHSINMGILLILIGLLTPLLAAGNAGTGNDNRLIVVLALSAVVYPAGLLLQYLTFTVAGEIVAALGAVAAILSLATLYIRIWKAVDKLHT